MAQVDNKPYKLIDIFDRVTLDAVAPTFSKAGNVWDFDGTGGIPAGSTSIPRLTTPGSGSDGADRLNHDCGEVYTNVIGFIELTDTKTMAFYLRSVSEAGSHANYEALRVVLKSVSTGVEARVGFYAAGVAETHIQDFIVVDADYDGTSKTAFSIKDTGESIVIQVGNKSVTVPLTSAEQSQYVANTGFGIGYSLNQSDRLYELKVW